MKKTIYPGAGESVFSGFFNSVAVDENCVFETPNGTGGTVTCVKLIGTVGAGPGYTLYPHQFCAVRNCVFDGESVGKNITGIDPGLGRGLIVEENQLLNMQTGIRLENTPAIDLIIWNNTFNVVQNGAHFTHNEIDGRAVGRIVLLENSFNLARGLASTGIAITGELSEWNFTHVIVRKNVIAADPASAGFTTSFKGIEILNTKSAVVENNVIDDCDSAAATALSYQDYSTSTFKAFNNQTTAGKLLRAYNTGTSRYLMELKDFTEDAIIGF